MQYFHEYIKDQIWIHEYAVRFGAMDIFARMTVIRLLNGDLIIHDPCKIDDAIKQEIDSLGTVKYIVVPGNYHHLFVRDFQQWYPQAETYLCPGLERKRPDIRFDWILGNRPDLRWGEEIEQVLVQGTRFMWEVAFLHKPSKTLILVDLVENIGDDFQHRVDRRLQFWWKWVFRMWNKARPAPEYQIGWRDKAVAKVALTKILSWHAERVILAHGELIERDIEAVLRSAWQKVLSAH